MIEAVVIFMARVAVTGAAVLIAALLFAIVDVAIFGRPKRQGDA